MKKKKSFVSKQTYMHIIYIEFYISVWMISYLAALAGWNETDLDISWKGKESKIVFCFTHHPRTENSKLNAWSLEARFMVGYINTLIKISCVSFYLQAVFRRYLRPEKDYLSFSLIYKKGERSLDLVWIHIHFEFKFVNFI